ncbi:MAG: hypothetical protein A2V88_06390 [Elusimicrobia bacterium RBG_16_66_12]|nr:MAG: hypothetical protein A2V88_06390 [Elusimicrobia bacterium RBG_16_66_12]
MRPFTRARALLVVAAAAFGLRLAFWARLAALPEAAAIADTPTYTAPADSLVREGSFLGVDGKPDPLRTPGYPALLALHRAFTASPRAPGLTQCLLDAGTAALTADAAMLLVPHPLAWTAGLLYALDPMAAAHAPLLASEPLFVFLLVACAWMLLRAAGWRSAALAGALLGASALTRPVAVYLWVPWSLGLLAFWGPRRWAWALAFALSAALPVGLWCARNAAVFGSFEISSMSGMNLYYWEGGAVLAAVEGKPFSETRRRLEGEDAAAAPPGEGPFDSSRRLRALARPIFVAHPGTLLRLHAMAALKMMLAPGTDQIASVWWPGESKPDAPVTDAHRLAGAGTFAHLRRHPSLWLALALTAALLAATYAGAAIGAFRLWSAQKSSGAVFFLLPAAYLFALSSWSFAYYRFRIPMIPLLATLAAGVLIRRDDSAGS